MAKSHEHLEALIERLERGGHGGDDVRLDIVRRAQRFKRSWVELAEGLSKLKKSRAYEDWGYSDLYDYCQKELHLKQGTIDKLVLSYGTLRTHAPDVLKHDGLAREIPSMDSVDYFSRAFGIRDADAENDAPARRRLDAPKAVLEELRSAVFDEARPVTELRKRFDPIFKPKREADPEQDVLRKTKALAEKLAEAVQAAPGLTDARVARVIAMVEALVRELDELIEDDEPKERSAARKASA
jgi:exonuclease VII small subunit